MRFGTPIAEGREERWRSRVAVWLIVALVALSRVYIGAHLPLDAVAGGLVGWVTGSPIDLATGAWAAAAAAEQMAHGQAGNE